MNKVSQINQTSIKSVSRRLASIPKSSTSAQSSAPISSSTSSSTSSSMPNKIAIYTANFGNYRNEFSNFNNLRFDKNIDYYIFTENNHVKLKNWNVIYTKLQPSLDFMDANRHTSKFCKFMLPEILLKYEIIIWIDTKSIKNMNFKSDKILRFFNGNDDMYFIKHKNRINTMEELMLTIAKKLES